MRHSAAALAFSFALAFPGPAAARAASSAAAPEETPESVRLYQAGLDSYTGGDLAAALASFREVLRLEPNNRSALAAVRRLEREATAAQSAPRPKSEHVRRRPRAWALDHFFLVSLPRWFYFERTLGDGLSDVGTLTALNARVVQLMSERKVSLARNRPFRKERQLRALLRRAPAATRRLEQA